MTEHYAFTVQCNSGLDVSVFMFKHVQQRKLFELENVDRRGSDVLICPAAGATNTIVQEFLSTFTSMFPLLQATR